MNLTIDGEEIVCTREHPFYSPIKGWTAACQLRAGDILVTVNGDYVKVEQIQHELLEAPINVYNFEVEGFHTYYVSEIDILVHNTCKPNNTQEALEAAKKHGYKPTGYYSKWVVRQRKTNTIWFIYIWNLKNKTNGQT